MYRDCKSRQSIQTRLYQVMYQVVMYRAHHAQAPWKGHSTYYSKTPIHRAPICCKPRFTAANFFPQIGLNMHIVNKQNSDLPRNPIYRGCFLSPKPAVNRGTSSHTLHVLYRLLSERETRQLRVYPT